MTAVKLTVRSETTGRTDAWWLPALVTAVVLSAFVVYATWAALVNADYYADPYLSPFYSPCLAANCEHTTWSVVGDWWTLSPALLILPIPLGFRLTCYYYRKAYYRAFFWSPPACAVRDARTTYSGESRFPFILQNAHRYFFYLTLPFPLILLWDGIRAFDFPDGFGMGLGTLILLSTPCCSAPTRCPVTPAATCAAGTSTCSRGRRAATASGGWFPRSTPATCRSPG